MWPSDSSSWVLIVSDVIGLVCHQSSTYDLRPDVISRLQQMRSEFSLDSDLKYIFMLFSLQNLSLNVIDHTSVSLPTLTDSYLRKHIDMLPITLLNLEHALAFPQVMSCVRGALSSVYCQLDQDLSVSMWSLAQSLLPIDHAELSSPDFHKCSDDDCLVPILSCLTSTSTQHRDLAIGALQSRPSLLDRPLGSSTVRELLQSSKQAQVLKVIEVCVFFPLGFRAMLIDARPPCSIDRISLRKRRLA